MTSIVPALTDYFLYSSVWSSWPIGGSTQQEPRLMSGMYPQSCTAMADFSICSGILVLGEKCQDFGTDSIKLTCELQFLFKTQVLSSNVFSFFSVA